MHQISILQTHEANTPIFRKQLSGSNEIPTEQFFKMLVEAIAQWKSLI